MISSLVTTLVFAVIGWLIFRRVTPPTKWWVWVLILLATILVSYVGNNAILIGVQGINAHFNDSLQGFGFGAIAGFVIKKK
jgi:hypothetical protein